MPEQRPRWLDEREARMWRAYLDLQQRLVGALSDQLLRDAGLSGADYSLLVPLADSPDGVMRSRELGAQVGWDRSRLSHQVRRMEQRGLVAREECDTDGRGSMVRLTDTGWTAIEDAAPEHVETVRRCVFDHLSTQEVDTLADIFGRLLDNLERKPASQVPRGMGRSAPALDES